MRPLDLGEVLRERLGRRECALKVGADIFKAPFQENYTGCGQARAPQRAGEAGEVFTLVNGQACAGFTSRPMKYPETQGRRGPAIACALRRIGVERAIPMAAKASATTA